jgi:hypothetical protein
MILEEKGYTPEKFIYKIMINTDYGCRCAYVGIQEDFKLVQRYHALDPIVTKYKYKTLYDLDVHGGLTYLGLNNYIIGSENPLYFGFDTGHDGDAIIPLSELTTILKKSSLSDDVIKKIITRYKTNKVNNCSIKDNENVRDLNFVKNECFKLSKQIKEINDAIETR